MLTFEVQERMARLAAERVRKLRHWQKITGGSTTDLMLREIIRTGFYRLEGFERLDVYLLAECGLTAEQAAPYMIWAIEMGHIDAKQYGINAAVSRGPYPNTGSRRGATGDTSSRNGGNAVSAGGGGPVAGARPDHEALARAPA